MRASRRERRERRERNFVNYPASVSVSERQRAQADAGIRKFSIRASSSVADRASHQSDCLKASQDWFLLGKREDGRWCACVVGEGRRRRKVD